MSENNNNLKQDTGINHSKKNESNTIYLVLFLVIILIEAIYFIFPNTMVLLSFVGNIIPYGWYSSNATLENIFAILISFVSLGLIPGILLFIINSPLIFIYSKFLKK